MQKTGKSYEIRTSELLKELIIGKHLRKEGRAGDSHSCLHPFSKFATSMKNTLTSNVSFMSQKLLKIANVNKLSKDILNRI